MFYVKIFLCKRKSIQILCPRSNKTDAKIQVVTAILNYNSENGVILWSSFNTE